MLALQFVLALVMLAVIKSTSRERAEMTKELYAQVKRIEALTSERREQMLKHYDHILEDLTNRVPVMVAGRASQQIFDTESKILQRLAELEPNLKGDETARQKIDAIIKSMEKLEDNVISITSEAVRQALLDGRSDLFDNDTQIAKALNR